MITVGVLGIQGAVKEHINMLNKLPNVTGICVKYKEDLEKINGLIIPGGESTAIGKLLRDFDLLNPIKKLIEKGLPVWGTCAGMILLSKNISNDCKTHLSVMDIDVVRNGYGSQLDSFLIDLDIMEVSLKPIPLVFIRAPYIKSIGKNVKVLASLNDNIIACVEKNMLVTSFHPELTKDLSFHKYFIDMIHESKAITSTM